MAPFWSIIFPMLILSSPSLASQMQLQISAISAAPAVLPDTAPSSSSLPPSTTLSPDMEPEFPSPGGAMPPSPSSSSSSSMPTIPSSPSPPNPDSVMPASSPELTSSPSMALPPASSSSIGHSPSGPLCLAAWSIGLLAFRSLLFSAV